MCFVSVLDEGLREFCVWFLHGSWRHFPSRGEGWKCVKNGRKCEGEARVLSYKRIYILRLKCLCGGHVIPRCKLPFAPHGGSVLGGKWPAEFELMYGRFFLKIAIHKVLLIFPRWSPLLGMEILIQRLKMKRNGWSRWVFTWIDD